MWSQFWHGISVYFQSLTAFLLESWANMTPDRYGIILLVVAIIGYIMMKSGASIH